MVTFGARLDTTWLAGRQPSPSARFRLFGFPYAGLGASVFRSWIGALGPSFDVLPIQLPGRETRHGEVPFRRIHAIADAVAEALAPCLDVPFAFFGHSMGALVAFEVSRRLSAQPGLLRLFVSARRAPHLADPLSPISALADRALIDAIQQRYGGIPAAVLAAPDLLDLLLPRLRADLEALETYVCAPAPPLPCGISVFGGVDDPTCSRNDLDPWSLHTSADAQVRMVEGRHLFLDDRRALLLEAIAADLGLTSDREVASC